jgi:hypothetical protein
MRCSTALRACNLPTDARVSALAAEVASLRDELTKAQSALTNLRARYHQLLEELRLLKRRLVVAKAERLDDVAQAQLAFDKLLAAAQAIEKVLGAAGSETERWAALARRLTAAPRSPKRDGHRICDAAARARRGLASARDNRSHVKEPKTPDAPQAIRAVFHHFVERLPP